MRNANSSAVSGLVLFLCDRLKVLGLPRLSSDDGILKSESVVSWSFPLFFLGGYFFSLLLEDFLFLEFFPIMAIVKHGLLLADSI